MQLPIPPASAGAQAGKAQDSDEALELEEPAMQAGSPKAVSQTIRDHRKRATSEQHMVAVSGNGNCDDDGQVSADDAVLKCSPEILERDAQGDLSQPVETAYSRASREGRTQKKARREADSETSSPSMDLRKHPQSVDGAEMSSGNAAPQSLHLSPRYASILNYVSK